MWSSLRGAMQQWCACSARCMQALHAWAQGSVHAGAAPSLALPPVGLLAFHKPRRASRWLPAVFVCVLHKRKMRKARADAEFMVHRWNKEREMGEWQHRVLSAPFGGSRAEQGI